MIPKNGIADAAKREQEFHPTRKGSSTPIVAWEQRAKTLTAAIDEVNALRSELDDLKEELRARPF